MTILNGNPNWREVKTLCYDEEQLEHVKSLGIPDKPDEVWLNFALEINNIVCVREDGEYPDRCYVYLKNGDSFNIQGSYSDVLDVIFHRA